MKSVGAVCAFSSKDPFTIYCLREHQCPTEYREPYYQQTDKELSIPMVQFTWDQVCQLRPGCQPNLGPDGTRFYKNVPGDIPSFADSSRHRVCVARTSGRGRILRRLIWRPSSRACLSDYYRIIVIFLPIGRFLNAVFIRDGCHIRNGWIVALVEFSACSIAIPSF